MPFYYVTASMPGRQGYGAPPPRGCCTVDHPDNGTWHVYRVARGERREFRAWLARTFLASDGRNRLAGAWPAYTIINRPGV